MVKAVCCRGLAPRPGQIPPQLPWFPIAIDKASDSRSLCLACLDCVLSRVSSRISAWISEKLFEGGLVTKKPGLGPRLMCFDLGRPDQVAVCMP